MMLDAGGFKDSPRSTRNEQCQRPSYQQTMNDTTFGPDDTLMQCADDSFLQMEKMCENTLNLNNISEHLIDLTTMASTCSPAQRKSLKKLSSFSDETRLNDIEAPSFINNSSLMSPNKNSPLVAPIYANRPSTILEVSEASSSFRTNMSSYRTALTRSGTEASEYYKTADEGSYSSTRTVEDEMMIKMPKIRSFYNVTQDMTKDSLNSTEKTQAVVDMTKDSLNDFTGDSSSGIESSFDHPENITSEGEPLNDTLEQIEFMLAQAQKMKDQTPKLIPVSPMVSKTVYKSPAPRLLLPKVFGKFTPGKANSPLMKFSPNVKSPANFKKPIQSATKVLQPSCSKKYQHVESPIGRYINHKPGTPLTSTARTLYGIGTPSKQYNFRDSEAFEKENESLNPSANKGSSLPFRAKTKSSAVTQVRSFVFS